MISLLVFLGCATSTDSGTDTAADGPVECDHVSGHICTFAGYEGLSALGKENVPANESYLYLPQDVGIAPDGTAYVLDWNNHRIRHVDEAGVVNTMAGNGLLGDGPEGDAKLASFNHPTQLSFDADGNMLIAAWHNSRVEKIDLTTNMLSFVAGTGARSFGGDEGDALAGVLDLPSSVVAGEDGTIYITDTANQRIRSVTTDGIIHTIAGDGTPGFLGDGGPAATAEINNPKGQQAAPSGRMDISPDQKLYLADTLNQRIRVLDLTTGVIDTFAGNGTPGYAGDGGDALSASFFSPSDVAVGPDGELYIADTENSCVRVVKDGAIATFAGICTEPDYTGDNSPATEARINKPYGVAADADGNVYIADTYNNSIRVVWR
jgi:sugar lactone lactonase YvrE